MKISLDRKLKIFSMIAVLIVFSFIVLVGCGQSTTPKTQENSGSNETQNTGKKDDEIVPNVKKEKVILGQSVGKTFGFTPVAIGKELGIWEEVGLEVENPVFEGNAKMNQALTANSIDFGLGSGPSMGYVAKGLPAKPVAAIAGSPRDMVIIVPFDSSITNVNDLKGKSVSITSPGSLTDWLARKLPKELGWTEQEMYDIQPIGGYQATMAALKTKQVDAIQWSVATGFELEKNKEGRVIASFGDYITDFYQHVLWATDKTISERPEVVKKVIEGWFKTIKYMKENRAETITLLAKYLEVDEDIAAKTYDMTIDMMLDEGKFVDSYMDVIADSLVDLGILETIPDPKSLYISDFVGQ